MSNLIKPPRLHAGDTVAAVSLSWGGAGDEETRWRYFQGKERIEKLLGLKVAEMPHTLSGSDYVYRHPEARARDLMAAFADPEIKGIFSCIGGEDTIRLLPYIDFDTIRRNPKIFMGYSDTTVNHFMCRKAGLTSFYGPAVLPDFAENVNMPEYTVKWLKKALFTDEPMGNIEPSDVWTAEHLPWRIENRNTARKFLRNRGYQLLQGSGKVRGALIGGCIEVMDWLRGTELFPAAEAFRGTILFLETSEDMPPPDSFRFMLRALGAMGVLGIVNGLVFGKPYGEKYSDEYPAEITKILAEYGADKTPVLCNLSFGHCEPKCCLPYGVSAEIDCERAAFRVLESGVS